MKRFLSIFLVISLLFICIGCGNTSSESDSKTEESEDSGSIASEGDKYTVGSEFKADDITVKLNSVAPSGETDVNIPQDGNQLLICNFTVTNDGKEDFNPSNFTASGLVDGTVVENILTGITDQFDTGTLIAPGKSTTGNFMFEVPQDWQVFQINVKVGEGDGKTAEFEVTPTEVLTE